MKTGRWKSIARTWVGIVAGLTATIAAVWLLSVYIHARRVDPVEKALVDSLRAKARTDAEVQKILQPELDREHASLVKRHNAYDRGGLLLLVSAGIFLAWFKWLRPKRGNWAGIPGRILKYLEKVSDRPAEAGSNKQPQETRQKAGFQPPILPLTPATVRAGPTTIDLGPVKEILETEGRGPEAIIPILQAVQSRYRYLPEAALRRICEASRIPPALIAGVATFYSQFRHNPVGEHIIRVCEGTACHVSGAVRVRDELRRRLEMANGSDTDPSGHFTIEHVACIGSCSLAPVIMIDERIYGRLSALSAGQALRDFIQTQSVGKKNGNGKPRPAVIALDASPAGAQQGSVEIRIGLGSCGIASGAPEVMTTLEDLVSSLGGEARVKPVGCSGLCHHEPLIEVIENGRRALYGNVGPGDVRKVVRRHVKPRGFIRKAREKIQDARARLLDDNAWIPITEREIDPAPYLKKQVRVVLENCGKINPLSLDDYCKREGTRALEECLKRLSPEEVIEKVRASGLRGRGGAGFPTAAKWDIVRCAPGSTKYVICNGDEGDPGAFMDRAVLESDPFRVIEGLVIAAYAAGAGEGFVYVRREYPIAVRHVRAAIREAEKKGLLGEHILGSAFSFKLQLREGAGAFVCGEETALIQSIEGKRGMPLPRPPYPAQSGLWGKPTLVNNVETLACVPWIIRRGPEAFAAMGTEKSKGTKVFSLVGKINRGGLIEVPMGITIREIVEEIGGGIKDGRKFKAVLAGGPSGGCIPARLADTRIDYEELASTGSIMGSGGLVVLDERDCAVEIARYFLHFTQNESCGKCTLCRVGTKRMLEILERICDGKGREQDLQILEDLGNHISQGSLCGLGQTAPNPVLTTLRYFREEYEAHVRERICPAAQCKALIHYRVLDSCTGCTLCAQACPAGAIEARPYQQHQVVDNRCTRCGMCVTACPENAIEAA
jgi:NADH:ubiquinone oxidoreductase subunit F (NADH-binding)/NADH:ubiquinone oxidoreductase subunit E/(2Fe-2S) ferredoxin/Pyruvate/2-oxoacid:ferredoxin oxidoreductase delta subunit